MLGDRRHATFHVILPAQGVEVAQRLGSGELAFQRLAHFLRLLDRDPVLCPRRAVLHLPHHPPHLAQVVQGRLAGDDVDFRRQQHRPIQAFAFLESLGRIVFEVRHVSASRLTVLKHLGKRLMNDTGVYPKNLLLLRRAFQHLPFLGRLAGKEGQRSLKHFE